MGLARMLAGAVWAAARGEGREARGRKQGRRPEKAAGLVCGRRSLCQPMLAFTASSALYLPPGAPPFSSHSHSPPAIASASRRAPSLPASQNPSSPTDHQRTRPRHPVQPRLPPHPPSPTQPTTLSSSHNPLAARGRHPLTDAHPNPPRSILRPPSTGHQRTYPRLVSRLALLRFLPSPPSSSPRSPAPNHGRHHGCSRNPRPSSRLLLRPRRWQVRSHQQRPLLSHLRRPPGALRPPATLLSPFYPPSPTLHAAQSRQVPLPDWREVCPGVLASGQLTENHPLVDTYLDVLARISPREPSVHPTSATFRALPTHPRGSPREITFWQAEHAGIAAWNTVANLIAQQFHLFPSPTSRLYAVELPKLSPVQQMSIFTLAALKVLNHPTHPAHLALWAKNTMLRTADTVDDVIRTSIYSFLPHHQRSETPRPASRFLSRSTCLSLYACCL
ncbi:hypothetical protein C8Q80DRAFT_441114 [Daedaleopsis nitida]|nr:hypothetical protein C8Q80DRAFT_441114 [Daedaleopsis nitida]